MSENMEGIISRLHWEINRALIHLAEKDAYCGAATAKRLTVGSAGSRSTPWLIWSWGWADRRNIAQLEDRSSQPSWVQPATDPRKACTDRLTVIITLEAPVSCFPYPVMLNLLHEGVWLLLPLPGNKWEKILHMKWSRSGPWSQAYKSCILDTFFFQFLLLVLFHFRDSCFSLYPQKMN